MARATSKAGTTTEKGLVIERRFSTAGVHPYDELEWEKRDAIIGDPEKPAFEQENVEFPTSWSQNATNIVAQKYFRGQLGSPERETSVKQMISRVAGRIAEAGREGDYFATDADADAFEGELTSILVNQKAAFNTPVWFNVGWKKPGQEQARPASSSASRTTWSRSSPGTPRRGSSSGAAPAPASTSPTSAARWSPSPRAVSPPVRSASCAAPTPGPGRSSRAARPAARPRWSCSTSTIRTSRSSSGARPTRRRRRRRCGPPTSTCDRRRRLHLDPVPERQQLGPGHRRVHGGRRRRRGLGPDRPHRRRADQDGQGPRPDEPDRRRRLAVRRSGRPVRHDHQPLAHLPEHRAGSTPRTRAPSTCTSTTRPATWPRST